MELQQVFDKIVTHLRAQGKKALDEYGSCVYLAPDGCQCAVGCLIPHDLYNPKMEKTGIAYGPVYEALMKIGVTNQHLDLLVTMQCIHDQYAVDEWEKIFVTTAYRFGLTVSEIGP